MKKTTIQDILNFKGGPLFATLTAYDQTSAKVADAAGIPLILVGDSASMTMYGYDTTLPISMEEMLLVVKAVVRSVKRSLVVADMPFLSYQTSIDDTVKNAGLFIKEGGAGAVKLEGGKNIKAHIKTLVDFGIPVLGHVGLTPQSFHQLSGYKMQGKSKTDAEKIIEDALAVQEAGAFGVVLECIPDELAKKITQSLDIPTIGIGAGIDCDGQIQVFHDLLGLNDTPAPKHAMQYESLYDKMLRGVKAYMADIKKG